MDKAPETTTAALRKPGRRLAMAVSLGVTAVAGILIGILWILLLPQRPYNLWELFPEVHREVSVAVFSVLLVWLGFAPARVGGFLARRPRQLPFLPLWAAAMGLVSWAMLRFAVTHESLGDILGWPTLGWGGSGNCSAGSLRCRARSRWR